MELEAALDALCAVDPAGRGGGPGPAPAGGAFAAVCARATAAFDAGRSWEDEGARTAAACEVDHVVP